MPIFSFNLLLTGALLAAYLPAAALFGDPPNVVIILADDLGIGDVSCYNEDAAWETPNIDQLAADGISFTDAHTTASICTPTRYGIMTGRYNWRSRLKSGGFDGYSRPLIENGRMTIAELFSAQGFRTAMVGKWHLGWDWAFSGSDEESFDGRVRAVIDFGQPIENGPEEHGFIYSYALAASLSSPPYVFVENSRPVSIPAAISVNYDEKAFWRKGPQGPGFSHVDVLAKLIERSVEYIRGQAGREEPFFLYVALTAPHAPIIPSTQFIGRSHANAYGDFVLQVDHEVGRIVDAITGDDRLENTLVIFTSDNGQSPRADFRGDELPKAGHNGSYIYRGRKFDIFEGGHRVPFIARWPGRIGKGARSDETISTVDLMATAAELLGLDLPEDVAEDSYSVLPALLQTVYSGAIREATVMLSGEGRFAIRKGDWKLILWPGSGGWSFPRSREEMEGLPPFQLYNLREDPAEQDNLVSLHPEVVTELKSLLEAYIKQGRSTPGAPQSNDGLYPWPELDWMAP